MIRESSVAGQFYAAKGEEIKVQIDTFNELLEKHLEDKSLLKTEVKMIVSPHAGFIYSGFTANIAHRILASYEAKRVVVIGPSHRVYISGASIALHDTYNTPFGALEMDKTYAQELQKKHQLIFQKDAHFEHSTETQMPFIKHYFNSVKVCEIVYGDISYEKLSEVISDVLDEEGNVVVISTDLSHFHTLNQARNLDRLCLEAMKEVDNEKMLYSGCEACGKVGVMAALEVAKERNFQVDVLDYRTSADVTKDEDSVVGYMSAIMR